VLLDHQAMARVRIPDVVIVKAVHVDLELTSIHIDVSDKQRRYVKCAIHTTNI